MASKYKKVYRENNVNNSTITGLLQIGGEIVDISNSKPTSDIEGALEPYSTDITGEVRIPAATITGPTFCKITFGKPKTNNHYHVFFSSYYISGASIEYNICPVDSDGFTIENIGDLLNGSYLIINYP